MSSSPITAHPKVEQLRFRTIARWGALITAAQALQTLLLIPFGRSLEGIVRDSLSLEGIEMAVGLGALIYGIFLVRILGWRALPHSVVTIAALLCLFSLFVSVAEVSHLYCYGGIAIGIRLYFVQFPLSRYHASVALALGLGLSIVDEGLQALHPERFFDIRDLGLNLASMVVAGWAFEPLATRLRTSKEIQLVTATTPIIK